jgi:hypothetical protein
VAHKLNSLAARVASAKKSAFHADDGGTLFARWASILSNRHITTSWLAIRQLLGRTKIIPPKKRGVFFSFHYDDDMGRAKVVCDSWRMRNPDSMLAPSFVDSSIWQKAKALGDENVKRVIREELEQTSVTCVLVGAHTWAWRWVRYEIARSVEQGKGLLAVRINDIADMKTRQTSVSGWNPMAYVGIGKVKGDRYFIFENVNGQWTRYQDHTLSVAKPPYLPDMTEGYVQPLSMGLLEYDYVRQNGSENLDAWIESAAQQAAK